MPRSWYRTQATMKTDRAVATLRVEFGPLGELVWRWLLDLRCGFDGEIEMLFGDFETAVLPADVRGSEAGGAFDLRSWLRRASRLQLISTRFRGDSRRPDLPRTIVVDVLAWDAYQPKSEQTLDVRERKRRSRARGSRRSHRDKAVPSRPTDVHTNRPTRPQAGEGRVSHEEQLEKLGESEEAKRLRELYERNAGRQAS